MADTKKISLVNEITDSIKESKNFVLVKFEKTSHQTLEALRKELKTSDSKIKILKNTLFEKAINKLSGENKLLIDLKNKFFPLRENSAIITFKQDWGKGLKTFYNFIQKEKSISFKFSLFDNQIYDTDTTLKIAQLPTKNELVVKVLGGMKSPTSNFVHALKYNINKFVYILSEQSKKGVTEK